MIPLPYRILAGIAALAIAFGGGWLVRGWKADSDELERVSVVQEAIDQGRAAADAAAMWMEGSRAAIDAQAYDTQAIIRETYREVTVPADCAVPDAVADSLRDATEATNRAVAGEHPREVPAAPASPGPAY